MGTQSNGHLFAGEFLFVVEPPELGIEVVHYSTVFESTVRQLMFLLGAILVLYLTKLDIDELVSAVLAEGDVVNLVHDSERHINLIGIFHYKFKREIQFIILVKEVVQLLL